MQRAQRRTQILIDAATRQLLGGGRGGSAVPVTGRAPGDAAADRARADAAASRFVIERLGNVHVKGKSQAIPVWAVKSKTRRVALARFVGAAAAVTKAAAAQAAAAQAAAAAAAQVAAADDQLPMIDLTDANIGQRSRQIETLMRTVERQRRRDLADMRSLLGDKSEDESAATTAPASESSSATSTAASTPSLASTAFEMAQQEHEQQERRSKAVRHPVQQVHSLAEAGAACANKGVCVALLLDYEAVSDDTYTKFLDDVAEAVQKRSMAAQFIWAERGEVLPLIEAFDVSTFGPWSVTAFNVDTAVYDNYAGPFEVRDVANFVQSARRSKRSFDPAALFQTAADSDDTERKTEL
ncbi:MAG: hypothetical protein MHM6MM_008953 [Cercozoa sp. M6MM]